MINQKLSVLLSGSLTFAGFIGWTVPSRASNVAATPAPASAYVEVARDANSKTWERPADEPGGAPHRYIELATGMHYLQDGKWVESREIIEARPDGSAAAVHGQHQVFFPADIHKGQIEMVGLDGKHLKSRPLGVSYQDGDKTVMIAVLGRSTGQIMGKQQVVYADAFNGIGADLRYTYTRAGFEQDLIFRQQLPSPEKFGFNPATTRVQFLTEFFEAPEPVQVLSDVRQPGDPEDSTLRFGKTVMGPGKAFGLQNAEGNISFAAGQKARVPVFKSWQKLQGRTLLLEQFKYPDLQAELQKLPRPWLAFARPSADSVLNRVSATRLLPPRQVPAGNGGPVQMARRKMKHRPGVVLDYTTLGTYSYADLFQSDTTYYINGMFFTESMTLEGGAVIKFDRATGFTCAHSSSGSFLNCETSPYRPAIFTAKDDNTVGENISGSSGNPSGYYAQGDPWGGGTGINFWRGVVLHDLRIKYLQWGFYIEYPTTFNDIQFVNCNEAIHVGGADININNGLFENNYTCFGGSGLTLRGVHLTVHKAVSLATDANLRMTNCILIPYSSGINLYSGNNIYTNKVAKLTSDVGVFQPVGGGRLYLTNNSPYRNAGTNNLSPALRARIWATTTYPPVLRSNLLVTADTTLEPQVQRDTDAPDLGYHYDPIDYITELYTITNCTLTVTNGAVIACNRSPGIWLKQGSSLKSFGTPQYPNRFTYYQVVQEQGTAVGTSNNYAHAQNIYPIRTGSGTGPINGEFHFTKFTRPAGAGFQFSDFATRSFDSLFLRDSEIWNGANDFSGALNTSTILQNNLFVRAPFTATNNAYLPSTLACSNNLFYRQTVTVTNVGGNPWSFYDNSFDKCAITVAGTSTDNGYNAYLACTGAGRLYPNASSDYVTSSSPTYQTGPLGTFYQPSSSPLIDAGEPVDPYNVGLYGYTVLTNVNGTIDGYPLDIGYHYRDYALPNATNFSMMVYSNTTTSVPVANVSYSPHYWPLTVVIDSNPTHGTLSWTSPDLMDLTYTTTGYTGPDSFTFHVTDGYYRSTNVTVQIFVVHGPILSTECTDNILGVKLSWDVTGVQAMINSYPVFRPAVNIQRFDPVRNDFVQVFSTANLPLPGQFVDYKVRLGETYTYRASYSFTDPRTDIFYETIIGNVDGSPCCPGDNGFWVYSTSSAADMAAAIMDGYSVTIANATYTGDVNASGFFGGAAASGFPLNSGVLMTSGDVINALGTNDDPFVSGYWAQDNMDLDLDDLVGSPRDTHDTAVLEFDVTSATSFDLQILYVFACDEYPEYISAYNDPMAVFMSTNYNIGNLSWIYTSADNYALVPGTSLPVSVNNINGGCANTINNGGMLPATNPGYYVDNDDPVYHALAAYAAPSQVYNMQYDGFTKVLTNHIPITAGVLHHIKIAVGDYGDNALDAALFFKGPHQSCP